MIDNWFTLLEITWKTFTTQHLQHIYNHNINNNKNNNNGVKIVSLALNLNKIAFQSKI